MDNILNNIFNKFSGLFNTSTGSSVLGIDIGSSSIKVVQLQRKNGSAVLQTYGEIALGPYAGTDVGRATKLDAEKISEALTDVLKESNTSTVDAAVTIPMSSSMVSVFDMPAMNSRQLNQMVPIEARKYIPVPISEVALDWFVIPKIGESNTDDQFENTDKNVMAEPKKKAEQVETMVVAIHNDTLNDYSSIVNKTGISTSFFEIEMFATARAVLDSDFINPVMIMDIGAGATKVYITERGIVRDSHIIGRGSQDLTLNISRSLSIDVSYAEKLKRNFGSNNAEQDKQITELMDDVFNPIFGNANSVMLNFQRKYNKNVAKVILVGGGSLLSGLPEKAQKYFAVQTEPGLPFDKVQTPAFLEPVLKKNGVMFAGAIGLALRKLQELE
jgi:type IV pilus assembly protein PilM